MKILVCGGRDYPDRARVFQVLDDLHFGTGPDGGPTGTQRLITCVVHGACGVDGSKHDKAKRTQRTAVLVAAMREWEKMKGADRWAHEWANVRLGSVAAGTPGGRDYVQPYPAKWTAPEGHTDKGAGKKRNQWMIDAEHLPGAPIDLVVAFPGGTGTADMVRRARAAGIKVMEIRP